MPPKVSIIINTFNRPRMLREAVYSCLTQTLQDIEIMIAIDHKVYAYTELGADIWAGCHELLKLDKRIFLVGTDLKPDDQSLNRFAHNINLAFKETTGKYISYLCDDDLFTPLRCSALAKTLDENPSFDVVYDAQYVYSIPEDKMIELRYAGTVLTQPVGIVNHNSVMHRRECFDKVGGWVENAPARLGDAWFFEKLAKEWPFYPVDIIGEVMRMGEQNCWSGKPKSVAEEEKMGAFA